MNFNVKNLIRIIAGGYLVYTGWQLYMNITENRPTNFSLMMFFAISFVLIGIGLICNFFYLLYKEYRVANHKQVERKALKRSALNVIVKPTDSNVFDHNHHSKDMRVGHDTHSSQRQDESDREQEKKSYTSTIIDLSNPPEAILPNIPSPTKADVTNDITREIYGEISGAFEDLDPMGQTVDLSLGSSRKPRENAFDIINRGVDDSFGDDIEQSTQEMDIIDEEILD